MSELPRKVIIASNGRVLIPSALRAALGMKEGDQLIARIENGALVLEPVAAAVARVQAMAAHLVRPGVSIVDELIADRRAEAERE